MIVVDKKMTDEERTQVLSKRVLEIPEWDEVRNPVIVKEPSPWVKTKKEPSKGSF